MANKTMKVREGEPARIDYQPPATWASDLQVLKSMIFADVKGKTQQERLESFYISQAELYDSYRFRMLHGRLPMVKSMPAPKGGMQTLALYVHLLRLLFHLSLFHLSHTLTCTKIHCL